MPRFALYPNQLSTFDTQRTAYSSNPTAFIEAVDADHVFQLTQHFEQPWYLHPSVTLCVRSTSVGDKIVDEAGNAHIVAPFGFEPPRKPLPKEQVLVGLQTLIERRLVDSVHQQILVEAYRLLLE